VEKDCRKPDRSREVPLGADRLVLSCTTPDMTGLANDATGVAKERMNANKSIKCA
jgi:hypothetical protein